jgi:hypothetical protein
MAAGYTPFPKSKRDLAMIRRVKSDNSAAIQRRLDRLQKLVGKNLPRVVEDANKRSLAEIQKLARANLAASLKSSRTQLRTGNLQRAIMDDQYSIADARRIQFLRDELIRPDVPYYRAIEHGDRSQVGEKRPFEFLSNGGQRGGPRRRYTTQVPPRRDAAITPGPGDRIVGSRERFNQDRFGRSKRRSADPIISRNRQRIKPGGDNGGLFMVTIKNPVPAYHYAQRAREQFRAKNVYNTELNRAIRASGLDREGIKFVLSGR